MAIGRTCGTVAARCEDTAVARVRWHDDARAACASSAEVRDSTKCGDAVAIFDDCTAPPWA
jgi:hypothetical protein